MILWMLWEALLVSVYEKEEMRVGNVAQCMVKDGSIALQQS